MVILLILSQIPQWLLIALQRFLRGDTIAEYFNFTVKLNLYLKYLGN